ncbi:MAG: hypothetical protein ABR507_10810 [Actinomycetota bacterium]|nr:hypothetical protein [Actinomycetota bacterium]
MKKPARLIARFLPIGLLAAFILPAINSAPVVNLVKADQAVSLAAHNSFAITNTLSSWTFRNDGGTCIIPPAGSPSCPGQYGQNFPTEQDSTDDLHTPPLPGFTVFDANLDNSFAPVVGNSFEYGLEIWSRDSTQGPGNTKTVFAAPSDNATRRDQSIFAGPAQIAGSDSLNVRVTYTVIPGLPVLRTLVSYTNVTTTAVAVTTTVATNLDDQPSAVVGSSTNDTTFDNTDRWIQTHGSDNTRPFITHVFYGPDNPASTTTAGTAATTVYSTTPSSTSSNRSGARADLSTTVSPGLSKTFMYFTGLSSDQSSSNALAGQFNTTPSLGSALTTDLSAADLLQIANWDFSLKNFVAVAPGSGTTPAVKFFALDSSGLTASKIQDFLAYSSGFMGGVSVATGDLDGDNLTEVATGAGAGGGPHVKVFDYDLPTNTVTQKASFFPYATSFTGGVQVAIGDVDPSSFGQELITVSGPGIRTEVHVYKLDATQPDGVKLLASFFPFDANFKGGGTADVADVMADSLNRREIIVGSGPGGLPLVKVFRLTGDFDVNGEYRVESVLLRDSSSGGPADSGLSAYSPNFTGGVNVAACNVDGQGTSEIVTGAGGGGGPHVRVFKIGAGGVVQSFASFFPFPTNFTGGVRVACRDTNADSRADVIVGAGPGGGPNVHTYFISDSGAATKNLDFFPFVMGFTGGVFVSGLSPTGTVN